MPGITTDARETIVAIINQIRDQYGPGSILKELLQNADDAQALRFTLIALDGVANATNSLLRAPGLLVLNDGPISEAQLDGMSRASRSDKTGDVSKVGRFGLGQKSLFNLCDAFIALGWTGDPAVASHRIINPYVDLGSDAGNARSWEDFGSADEAALIAAGAEAGFGMRGVTIYIPLRSPDLRPSPRNGFSKAEPDLATLIDAYSDPDQLGLLTSALRNVRDIEIRRQGRPPMRFAVAPDSERMIGASNDANIDRRLSGTIAAPTSADAIRFTGRERQLPSAAAARFRNDANWPSTIGQDHEPIAEKALPHGAVILTRNPATTGASSLYIHWAVFLPTSDDVVTRIMLDDRSIGRLDLLLHGYFFVDSGRKKLSFDTPTGDPDSRLRTLWNGMIRDTITLPLLLPSLLGGFEDLALSPVQQRSLVRGIAQHAWWTGHRQAACGESAFGEVFTGGGATDWRVVPASSVRPLPPTAILAPETLLRVFPNLRAWAVAHELSLMFDEEAVLSGRAMLWRDDEVADLLEGMDPRTLSRTDTAAALAVFLGEVAGNGQFPLAATRLCTTLRAAFLSEDALANAAAIANLIPFVPQERLFPLPKSVENRQVLRALAAAPGARLAIRATFAPGLEIRQLDTSTAIDWLGALEPILAEPGDLGDQANTAVIAIIAAGPTINELAENERSRNLRVVRARRVGSDRTDVLSLSDLAQMGDQGRLFDGRPSTLLSRLAAAVPEVPLFAIRLPDESGAARRLKLQAANSPAAALEIVRQADSFGSVAERSPLLVDLLREEHADPAPLRALCVGAPVRNLGFLTLVSLGAVPKAVEGLVVDALASDHLKKIVPLEIAKLLSASVREQLRIQDVDIEAVGRILVAAFQKGSLSRPSTDQAKALLQSGLPDDVLLRLPLFRGNDGSPVTGGPGIYRELDFRVPPSLRAKIVIHLAWPEPELARIQRAICAWTPTAQINTALEQPNPEHFAVEILDALHLVSSEDLPSLCPLLRQSRWLKDGDGACHRGSDVLNLAPEVNAAIRNLLPNAVFLPFDLLTAAIRDHEAASRLRTEVLPDEAESLAAVQLMLEDQPTLVGCPIDPDPHMNDLRTIARAGVVLDLPAWPLLAALLKGNYADELLLPVARSITGNITITTALASLNFLATRATTGSTAEAARRLHFAFFESLVAGVRPVLPIDLQLPADAGSFLRADCVAVRGHGVAATHLLDKRYADLIDPPRSATVAMGTVSATTAQTTQRIIGAGAEKAAFAEAMRAYFEPWRGRVPSDAIVFLLGLLGRDEAMRALAADWQDDTRQGDFERIWQDLDTRLASSTTVDDLRAILDRTIFTATVVTDSVLVASAAGPPCTVPLASELKDLLVGNPMGSRRRVIDQEQRTFHSVDLAMVAQVAPLKEARRLFERLIHALCPPLLLALEEQRTIVLDCFSRSFEIEQVTIEDTIAKLKDQGPSHVRTLVLPPDGHVRTALRAFDDVSPTDKAAIGAAKETLWATLEANESAGELIEAVRTKIRQMGYAEDRVLFELLQNADDAYLQLGIEGGELCIEVEDTDEGISQIRVVHWGRPINGPGRHAAGGAESGYRHDLYNMLAINHSEKPVEERVTGKFGLGFKTVHMLTDTASVASGFLGARIVGGFLPQPWAEGIDASRALARDSRVATLIHLPIAVEDSAAAEHAVEAFRRCLEWLPAIAKSIRTVTVARGAEDVTATTTITGLDDTSPLAAGIKVVENGGSRCRRALRFDLGDGFAMLVGIGRSGPEAIVSPSALWNLVPLQEQADSDWILSGPFEVDPGRSHITGTTQDQANLFARLGVTLGQRLVELFDVVDADPQTFLDRLDIEPSAMASFWRRLADRFTADLRLERISRLHANGAGLARLWNARPSIATGVRAPCDAPVRATDICFRLSGILVREDMLQRVVQWPCFVSLAGSLVSDAIGERLTQLGLPAGAYLTLAVLLSRELGPGKQVSTEMAHRLGALINLTTVETEEFAGERWPLKVEAATAQFRSAAGTWEAVRNLSMATGGVEIEHSRARFAPDRNVLAVEYQGLALEFFNLARASSGYGPNAYILRQWAEQATDSLKQTAFLRYLLTDRALALDVSARPLAWLPSPLSLLRGHPLCTDWSDDDVTTLLALMEELPPYLPPPVADDPPEPYEPDDLLGAIHDWWVANRTAEGQAYDEDQYPEEFDFGALERGDSEAWFTMFAFAIFQNIGRTEGFQARSFVVTALRDGWWNDVARYAQTMDIQPWIDRLETWSDPNAGDQVFMPWRQRLVELYAIAKYLPEYVILMRALPAEIRLHGPVALESLMRPFQSAIAARLGVVAPAMNRSIGMGLNWLIRELARHGYFAPTDLPMVNPYAWSSTARVRRLLRHADVQLDEPGHMDFSRVEFDEVESAIGRRATYLGDLDLPLQLIARKDYRHELRRCVVAAGMDPSRLDMSYQDD
ncbi:hypothetical protein [Sphingomonas sp. UYEF23]|uniref:sacsin N-terminal ATP-binding-like domain-containing protein n=1 Tax=Sphingomonas sp. UYEF23 TaxID=1756408 RepID=UPI0033985113